MTGADDAEVPPVKRSDAGRPVTFGSGDHERVCGAQRQVAIAFDQVSGAGNVGGSDRDELIDAVRNVAQKIGLGVSSGPRPPLTASAQARHS